MRNSDGSYSQPTHTTFEAMFYRLAEVEDFLEETGISDFAELKRIVTTNAVGEENQSLKGNWEKLREFVEDFKRYDDAEFNMACEIISKMQELESADGEL